MGPKSKSNKKSEWQECLHCGIIINYQDLRLHTQECTSSQPLRDLELAHSRKTCKKYGFIQNGTFHGLVKRGKKLPDVSNQEAVLLHPSTMKICKICLTNFVIVRTANEEALCLAWSSDEVHPSNVCIQSNMLTYSEGDLICIQPLRGTLGIARVVNLICVSEETIFQCPEFEMFVKLQFYKGHYGIAVGSRLRCNFYGQMCDLIVREIIDENKHSHTLRDDTHVKRTNTNPDISLNNLSSIESTLASLQLDESGDRSKIISSPVHSVRKDVEKYSFLSSTPVKNMEGDCNNSELLDHYQSFQWKSFLENPEDIKSYFLLNYDTKFTVQKGTVLSQEESTKKVCCDDIGGLQHQIQTIKEIIEFPVKYPEYETYGLMMTKGIILHGSSGTGKTLLAKAISHDSGFHFIDISGPDIYSRYYGESETKLRKLFKEAVERAPTIIFIDEIDAMCPKREGSSSEQEKRVTSTLMNLLDNLPTRSSERVLVLAATNKIDSLDTSLRRPGRFDKEVEIPVPSCKERTEILKKLLRVIKHNLKESDIRQLADGAHGYTGADLASVCSKGIFHAFVRNGKGSDDVVTSFSDMKNAIKEVKPSAMREISIEVPKVSWNDIGGMHEVKQKLKQTVNWPLKHPEAFKRLGIHPPRGLLMYGPPGCSKTMVAKAVATESGLNFLAIKGPELFNKWVGESEKAVRELFRKAREASPSVVFFDEIDALAVERGTSSGGSNVGERVLTQLLTEMDGIEQLHGVIVLAATNRPDMIDKALLRPGRLDNIIYVPLPDPKAREEILNLRLKKMPIDKDVDVNVLVSRTNGYSGAEIVAVCNEAALSALQEDIGCELVKWSHFNNALSVITPRTSVDMIKFYEHFYSKSKKRFKE